jgi:glutamyl-tRNA reductase
VSDLIAVGLNHTSAAVALRERLAVSDDEQWPVLEALQQKTGLSEIMLVSTCNRVEVYGVTATRSVDPQAVMLTLADLREVAARELHGRTFIRAAGDAARHIFRVTASLESMVLGEPQILGQVKDAYFRAKELGVVGPILDRCLSLAFKSAKRVRTETEIARGASSVSSVAVHLATSIFGDLRDCGVLVVGAGEMAEQSAAYLRDGGLRTVVVVNRSAERGQALAEAVCGRYEPWEHLEAELQRADIVITSTGSRLPIIDRKMVKPIMKRRRHRPLFFVDIAVPRDVDADVGSLEQVFLYNIDDLQSIVHDNLRSRQGEAERAGVLVEEEVSAFLQWMRSRSIAPLLGRLQSHGRSIAEAEVQRALARLGDVPVEQRAVVEQLAHSIVQKLLHRPMTNVRKASSESVGPFDGPALAEALSALFALDVAASDDAVEAATDGAAAGGRERETLPELS